MKLYKELCLHGTHCLYTFIEFNLRSENDKVHKVEKGTKINSGARWLSGRVSDSGARGRGFDTYRRHVVSLSKTLYSPKVLVNYPGSGGSVPTKKLLLGR